MDFALFMERYGYKIILGIFALIFLGFIAIPLISFAWVFKQFGLYIGGIVIVIILMQAFLVKRRALDSYAKAHAKYFYDDKWYKRR
ncbi:hypothetical protein PAP_04960 [Palaeococcus pacificus DY20341]|uniref:Uncharacterized protein n=1 Tax=Palaeococcus pacificus DY20341 TaxID=1343739 RepID=A0A075LXV4_9EURY|nr:hypothetical protein [Palaeococcus pacificus]AIF69403.1 hypothetical protein PAP_04960 [Palaeococcus pacificus DY20341]